MGEYAGAFARDGVGVNPTTVRRLTEGLRGVSRPVLWHGPSLALAHRPFTQAEARDGKPMPRKLAGGVIFAVDCLLDEPAELAAALGAPPQSSHAELVAAACEHWGDRAPERMIGHFALTLWDEKRHRLTLARDALGARPLFYVESDALVLFATSLPMLLSFPETSREIDELVLAQTLTIEPNDLEQTLYRSIRRVPPGGIAVFDLASHHIRRYWTAADIKPVTFKRDAEYVEGARALFDRAVRLRSIGAKKLGATLSGGLDSSGIVATLARQSENVPVRAFHRAPGAPHPYDALDEIALIGAMTSRYPNIDLTVVDDMRAYQRDIDPEIDAATFALPGAASVNISWFDSLYSRVEQAGVDLLLTGAAGNVTLSWVGSPTIARDLAIGRWQSALRAIGIGARSRHQSIARFLAAQMLGSVAPHALQHLQRLHKKTLPWTDYSMVSEEFLRRIDYEAHAREVGFDIPFRRRASGMREARVHALQSQINRDKSAALRGTYAFKGRDPYGYLPLVEFTIGMPNRQFWHAGTDRWLARRVLADRVPSEILGQLRRGMQCPEWYTVMSRRHEGMMNALARIERSPLACRVLDVKRMRSILENWPKDAVAAQRAGVLPYGHALNRGLSIGGFLRWYEGGNG